MFESLALQTAREQHGCKFNDCVLSCCTLQRKFHLKHGMSNRTILFFFNFALCMFMFSDCHFKHVHFNTVVCANKAHTISLTLFNPVSVSRRACERVHILKNQSASRLKMHIFIFIFRVIISQTRRIFKQLNHKQIRDAENKFSTKKIRFFKNRMIDIFHQRQILD